MDVTQKVLNFRFRHSMINDFRHTPQYNTYFFFIITYFFIPTLVTSLLSHISYFPYINVEFNARILKSSIQCHWSLKQLKYLSGLTHLGHKNQHRIGHLQKTAIRSEIPTKSQVIYKIKTQGPRKVYPDASCMFRFA